VNRCAALVVAVAGCRPTTTHEPPAVEQLTLLDLAGEWRWLHHEQADGTSRVEDERWELRVAEHGGLSGSYLRTVEVRSLDGLPFPCNQRTWYVQRARFDVTITATDDGFVAHETAYDVEPSPCDHGFRRTGSYKVVPRGNRVDLRWDGGVETLWHTSDLYTAIETPWQPPSPIGQWRWHTRAYDDDGNVRDEWETWDVTRRDDATLDATYRRSVRTTSVDGTPIACAGTPSWGFDDVYALDATREDGLWHVRERGVGAGDHPCLRDTPRRTLDEAIAEQIGDYLVLEWRGKRRQVLRRQDAE
jgi:hypothetical protein